MTTDAKAGALLVAHVIVALCDVDSQGVVPPPDTTMCDTDKPGRNLYWGALYGVRTHLKRSGWKKVDVKGDLPTGVVDRVVYKTTIARAGKNTTVYVVAEAHDGRKIRTAIQTFLGYASGYNAAVLEAGGVQLPVGGAAHVVAFVGHNGLMDFSKPEPPKTKKDERARSSVVLACASKPYFEETLTASGAHPLLLTTGLMAPEAYVLDSALRSWFAGGLPAAVHESAAKAYDKYQKCGLRGARRLFSTTD